MDVALVEDAHDAAVQAAVRLGLRANDPVDVPPRDYRALCLSLRAPDGRIVGGLHGGTMWSWLMLDGLWVDESLRGRGLGARLLLDAESRAIARGCTGAWLGTFDFQARGFYERHGYTVFSTLDGFPAGHAHFNLRKALLPTA